MDRFRQLLIIFVFRKKSQIYENEFLKIVQDNFLDSLKGASVELKSLVDIDLSDLDNLNIKMHGFYSVYPTIFTLILDKKLNVKSLFVA